MRKRSLVANESAELKACLQFLRSHPRVAWAARMNVGAYEVLSERGRRYIRFGFPGCSDIIGQLKDGRLLAFEVKRKGNGLTGLQMIFLENVAINNGVAAWGTIDECMAMMRIAFPRYPTIPATTTPGQHGVCQVIIAS